MNRVISPEVRVSAEVRTFVKLNNNIFFPNPGFRTFRLKCLISFTIYLPMSKIALITGATAGIGEACAHVFARERYDLILTGRRVERLEKLAKQLNSEYNVEVAVLHF